jgi:hypothetical protein|tara:strand:- start:192 stop:401 length:210 start_codon:yes stop_codon:yes gene_type:complete
MKANFKKNKVDSLKNDEKITDFKIQGNEVPEKKLTKEEFQEYIIKSGAKGSFVIYRSDKKDEELGLEEL